MTYSTMIFEPLAKLDIKTRNLWCNLTWTLMCLLIYFVLLNKLLLKNANLDDIKSKAWKNANNRTPKIRHDQNGFARTKNWTTFEYLIAKLPALNFHDHCWWITFKTSFSSQHFFQRFFGIISSRLIPCSTHDVLLK